MRSVTQVPGLKCYLCPCLHKEGENTITLTLPRHGESLDRVDRPRVASGDLSLEGRGVVGVVPDRDSPDCDTVWEAGIHGVGWVPPS